MPWLPKMDKDDFVGKLAVEHFAEREPLERLVGFVMEDGVVPAEGAQIVIEGYPAGRITSARRSEAVGSVIGLAWLPVERAEDGTRFEVRVDRRLLGGRVKSGAFYDVDGKRMRVSDASSSTSSLPFALRARQRRRRRCGERSEDAGSPVVQDLWPEGKVEIRGDLDLVAPRAGEELVQLTPRRGFLFTGDDPADVVARLREVGVLAYDATGALAGIAIEGEQLMRRLTDLDLDELPAAGPLLSRVTAIVLRDEGERFRVYVPQELAHDVAVAVLDAAAGLPNTGVRLKPDPSHCGTDRPWGQACPAPTTSLA